MTLRFPLFATFAAACALAAQARPLDDALPMVGTAGHGHTYPGATSPFGLVQLSPDTRTEGWDGCSGYDYSDTKIQGFSHTHLSGTGARDLGEVMVLPVVGAVSDHPESEFTHAREFAQPGYYRVHLDRYDVEAELTATAHAGMHRYTFPESGERNLLIDLVHGIGGHALDTALRQENDHRVTGFRHSSGWAKDKTLYFALETSQPIARAAITAGRGVLGFAATGDRRLILRVGVSPTSIAAAKRNLAAEIATWDFDAVRQTTQDLWSEHLSRIAIETDDPAVRQTFYSALYHTMLAPTLYNNADGSYSGADHQVHQDGFANYCTFSLWDTFRAEHPLLILTEPERVNDFMRSILAFYQQSPDHLLPIWPLAGCETGTMIGYHAVPVLYDAYAKGFRGFDAPLTLRAMVASATSGRNFEDEYEKYGYVLGKPMEVPRGKRKQSVSRTEEYSFDDWCIARMAQALGNSAVETQFDRRARNYRNLFDPSVGFFRGKNAAGVWDFPSFDPKLETFDDYTEANAWQYTFAAMHDVPGLIQLYGGREAFIRKLDELFNSDSDVHHATVDISGLIGQYAHGNEPCHHVAYLYALAGAQYKTAARVRQIELTQYDNSPEGLDGNDDCGQTSAWYVWSALGLYPVNPDSGIYVIGSPLVERAVVRLDPKYCHGTAFTVIAHNQSVHNNLYVQSAKLNGRPLDRPWITHQELTEGGTLELEMGVLPNPAWGAAQ